MTEHVQYILADPCGNTTILVLSEVPLERRSALSARLLQPDCVGAEQAGFLTFPAEGPADIHIHMMGGEFCGNASRSAAAYAAQSAGVLEKTYRVSCSGCEDILSAHVKRRDDGQYDAAITMPLPSSITAVIVDVGGMPHRFYRVDFGGIVHFVYLGHQLETLDKDLYWQSLQDYAADENYEAYGLILYDPSCGTMLPAVYVTATVTLYWEQSCGSGSAAVAAVAACLSRKDFVAPLCQPGGTIYAQASWAEEGLQEIRIGSAIKLYPMRDIEL